MTTESTSKILAAMADDRDLPTVGQEAEREDENQQAYPQLTQRPDAKKDLEEVLRNMLTPSDTTELTLND